MKVFLNFFAKQNAYMKLMIFYRRSKYTDVFLNFVSNVLLRETFIK
jgi:hypothetical protein